MKRGLSLIEVIFSTALLGLMATVVLLFALSGMRPSRLANERDQAVCLAESSLSEARALGVGRHTLAVVGEFRRDVQIEQLSPGLFELTLTTRWQDKALVRKVRYCDAPL